MARKRRSAFTLIELLVSITAMTLIMTGMASAILLATHAIPDDDDPFDAIMEARELLDIIEDDLMYATAFKTVTKSVAVSDFQFDALRSGVKVTFRYMLSAGSLQKQIVPGDSFVQKGGVETFSILFHVVQDDAGEYVDFVVLTLNLTDDPSTAVVSTVTLLNKPST